MGPTRKGRAAVIVPSDDEDDQQRTAGPSASRVSKASTNKDKVTGLQSQTLPNRSREASKSSQASQSIIAKDQSRATRRTTRSLTNIPTASSTDSKTKGQQKTGNKNIYSFFNAATQKQQSQVPSSPEKEDLEEAIEDDIDSNDLEDSTGCSHKSIEKASRKRAGSILRPTVSIRGEADRSAAASQKFIKTQDGIRARVASTGKSQRPASDERPWTDRYAPTTLEELAVHKKKVSDVAEWFKGVFAGQNKKCLLVLKGPAGSGKTAAVSCLAKAIHFEVNEWKNPATSDFTSNDYVSVLSHFEDYIGRTGQFGCLDLVPAEHSIDEKKIDPLAVPVQPSSREAVLIEEFPNTFMRADSALRAFRSTIQNFLARNTAPSASSTNLRSSELNSIKPIIMTISETHISASTSTADTFTAQRLLGSEILHHPGTSVIEFKPVAPTILTKALELIIVKEARHSGRRWAPGPQVLKALAETGDMRSAINSLEFLCVRGDSSDAWGSKVAFTKPKRAQKEPALTKMEQESLKIITNRESSLELFHGLGKVLYNKRQEPSPSVASVPQPPGHLSQHRRLKMPENDADDILDQIGADIETFVSALHENYALSCNGLTIEDTLDCLDTCIESLSDADLLSPSRFALRVRQFQTTESEALRQNEISFQVSVRGLLFALPSPVKRISPPADIVGDQMKKFGQQDAFKMFFPASIKLWKRREELQDLTEFLITRLQRGQYPQQATSGEAKQDEDLTRMGSGSSAKTEGLLEYLPYKAILQRSQGASATFHELEQVTRFSGVGFTAEEEDKDDVGLLSGPPAASTGIERNAEKLILSDDDIED